VHEKLTHSRKLVEGMKAGLKPDISDDENPDENEDISKMKSYPVKEDKAWTVAVTRGSFFRILCDFSFRFTNFVEIKQTEGLKKKV
jgi:hypothetical protein